MPPAGCIHCSECFTGCKHNAKNTTTTNYLYLAEQNGAEVHPLTTVTSVDKDGKGGYVVETERSNGKLRKGRRRFTAEQVVFAAAALGTQKLLHKLRADGTLPELSPRLAMSSVVRFVVVEDEQIAAEIGELRGVLHRGRRGNDLHVSGRLARGAVGAEIRACLLGQCRGCGRDGCRGSHRQQHWR